MSFIRQFIRTFIKWTFIYTRKAGQYSNCYINFNRSTGGTTVRVCRFQAIYLSICIYRNKCTSMHLKKKTFELYGYGKYICQLYGNELTKKLVEFTQKYSIFGFVQMVTKISFFLCHVTLKNYLNIRCEYTQAVCINLFAYIYLVIKDMTHFHK